MAMSVLEHSCFIPTNYIAYVTTPHSLATHAALMNFINNVYTEVWTKLCPNAPPHDAQERKEQATCPM